MPRKVSGLGGSSKIKLRGFTQLLKNLDPGTRAQLEQAFSRAEDLIDFHSRSVPERENKRKASGLIQAPVLTVEATIIGAFVTWDRIDDPRIAFYEVQLSDDNVFANPDTFTTLEAFFAVENVTTTKFVRVRGVRAGGETGLFSDTAQIRPTVTAPTASSFEFYPGYFEGSDPPIGKSVKYGQNLNFVRNLPQFYTVLDETFYADRLTGGFSVWGFLSNRLHRFIDGGVTPWDRVRFKLNGVAVTDGYFPHWTNVIDEEAAEKANEFDRDDSGDLMTFYSQGGYTASFGPYNVTIPSSFAGDGPNDPNRVIALPAGDGIFYWKEMLRTRTPARFDQGQFEVPSFDGKPGDTIDPTVFEAFATNISAGERTEYIYFHNFKLNVPDNREVTGIKAELKRRQPNIKRNLISPNLGNVRPDIGEVSTGFADLPEDFIVNNIIPGVNKKFQANSNEDILEDIDFGKFLDLSRFVPGESTNYSGFARRGPLVIDSRGADKFGEPNFNQIAVFANGHFVPETIDNKLTISLWFNLNSQAYADSPSTSRTGTLFRIDSQNTVTGRLTLSVRASGDSGITRIQFSVGTPGFQFVTSFGGTPTGADAALDKFHHIAVIIDGTSGNLDKDEVFVRLNGKGDESWSTDTSRQNGFSGSGRSIFFDNNGYIQSLGLVGKNNQTTTRGNLPVKVAQLGLWDKPLNNQEVFSLFEGLGFADYRFNFGDYESADRLLHYFLFFPNQPDVRDHEVFLVDQNPVTKGARIRTDLDNKAITTESWPQLSHFFYTDTRQFGILPLANSDGIPYDNLVGIGYQDYGGEGDVWGRGSSWSNAEVNSFYFGFAARAINQSEKLSNATAMIDHARMTVFFQPEEDRSVRATAEVAVSNQFYVEREVFGGLFNVLEIGERLSDLPDC